MNEINLNVISSEFEKNTQDKLLQFAHFLEKWNRVYNLTAAKSAREIFEQHIADSLSISDYIQGPNILDVGSGAGFPGLPLAIIFPQFQFTLLDSKSKKVRFLNQAVLFLGLKNVKVVEKRVEEFDPGFKFETITTRATYSANEMINKVKHLLGEHGKLLMMKGKRPENELSAIPASYHVEVHKLTIPNLNAERHLISIQNKVV